MTPQEIKALRARYEMSQMAFAALLRETPVMASPKTAAYSVSNWEHGKNTPDDLSRSALAALAKRAGLPEEASVKEIRDSLGVTQFELAVKLRGVTVKVKPKTTNARLAMWEMGRAVPDEVSSAALAALAEHKPA
ncbi:hypothetical protein KQI63_05985 [bacterium]|nr:hypothetical protein [bacterium]